MHLKCLHPLASADDRRRQCRLLRLSRSTRSTDLSLLTLLQYSKLLLQLLCLLLQLPPGLLLDPELCLEVLYLCWVTCLHLRESKYDAKIGLLRPDE